VDHAYIEKHSVAERYLDHALTPAQRADFEAHLVDCQECTDRVLLAEMFHNRNGAAAVCEAPMKTAGPLRTRIVVDYTPRQLILLVTVAAMLLLLIPCAYFLWELHTLGR
jgi:hypothetical protein